ncbi:MAG TPA: DMT family transporter [Gaiellaceae bacterium]
MTGVLLVLFAIVAGLFLPLQAAVNTRLAHFVGGPVRASMVSFAVGAIALLVVALLFYRSGSVDARHAPWWAWIGGFFGAFYVTSAVVVPPRIGAAPYFGLLVAAQLVLGVLIDRFGLIGYPERALSPLRLAGVALLVVGALLVRLF